MSILPNKKIVLPLVLTSAIIGIASLAIAKPFDNMPYYRINPLLTAEANKDANRQNINQPTILLNSSDIATLRANPSRYASVITTCNGQLNYQPHPIAVLNAKPHYTTTGPQPPDPGSVQLSKDGTVAYQLGFCYLMTQDERYAVAAQHILDVWASTFQQTSTHQSQGVINFYMPYMVIAADWVRPAAHWDSHRFDTFLRNSILPLAETDNDNNHGLWGVFLKGAIGAYLGNERIIDSAQARWQEILQGAVAADGTMPHELARSDTNNFVGGKTQGIKGIAYTHYAMLPASLAAKVFSDTGRDVWHTQGGTLLQKAFNRAAILTLHPETSPYYQSNNGQLIGVQNGSYFPLLLKYFPNKNAQEAVQLGYVSGDKFMLPILFK